MLGAVEAQVGRAERHVEQRAVVGPGRVGARFEAKEAATKLVAALERVGQALRVELRERAGDHGLTPTQAQILLHLASERPPRRRVGALAAALDVRQPTISDAVAALERKGLLERRRDTADARSATLRLTARGRAVGDRLGAWDERAGAELRRLPQQARQASLSLLLDLIAGLQRAGVVGVARTCPTWAVIDGITRRPPLDRREPTFQLALTVVAISSPALSTASPRVRRSTRWPALPFQAGSPPRSGRGKD